MQKRTHLGVALVHGAIVMALSLSGCDCRERPIDGWQFGDKQLPEVGRETPATPPTPQPNHETCVEVRDFIGSLGIVDDATLTRRPTGKVVEIHQDDGADGVDRCWIRLYDESGREIVNVQNSYAPSTPDRIGWTLAFDPVSGEVARYRSDDDGDGIFDVETESRFDDLGHRVWQTRDEGIDGSIESRAHYTYDGDEIVQVDYDEGDDGVIDSISYQRWRGDTFQMSGDWDADGTLDSRSTFTYDDGRQTEYVGERRDETTGDWIVERTTTLYNDDERPISWLSDLDDDGTIDQSLVITWDGETMIEEHDFEHDGTIDSVSTTEWVAFESPWQRRAIYDDWGADGELDQIRRWHYDSQQRAFAIDFIDGASGKIGQRQTYVFAD